MPLIQKIIQIGDSKAITIPKSWLIFYERQIGCSIKEVSVEVNSSLVIRPIMKVIENTSEEKGHSPKTKP
jgi:antitoxin component of MazEF toxin-antitoxin module